MVPILTYHSIDSSGSVISTSPDQFRRQMEILKRSAFTVLPLNRLCSIIQSREAMPESSVVITFDDGFKNVYQHAFPVLKEHGFQATIYLVTSFCGKNNRWPGQPGSIPLFDLMDWTEIEEMAENQMEFGSHSATHRNLKALAENELQEEILHSKEVLVDRTGRTNISFAYPYGKQSSAAKRIVEEKFYSACSTNMDFVSTESDLYFLPRIDMYYFSGNDHFAKVGTSAFARYIRFRSAFRFVKQLVTGD